MNTFTPCRQLLIFAALFAVACLLFIKPQSATALSYKLEADYSAIVNHDNNIGQSTTNGLSSTGKEIEAAFGLSGSSETDALSMSTNFKSRRYTVGRKDSDVGSVFIDFNRQLERHRFSFSGNYANDTTRDVEQPDFGLNSDEKREAYSFSSSWSYRVTAMDSINLGGRLSKTEYGNELLRDYETLSSNFAWSRTLNERVSFSLQANYQLYQPDENDNWFIEVADSTTVNQLPVNQSLESKNRTSTVSLAANYQWSERLSVVASYGSSESKLSYAINDPENICLKDLGDSIEGKGILVRQGLCDINLQTNISRTSNAQLGLNWAGELSTLSGEYSDLLQPGSTGTVTKAKGLSLKWGRKLTEKSQLDIFVRATKRESGSLSADSESKKDLETQTIKIGYSRRIDNHWGIGIEGRREYQQSSISQRSHSDQLNLRVTYSPQSHIW